MPIIRSAKKALRQSKRRRAQNLLKLKSIRNIRRDILKLKKSGKTEEAKAKLPLLYKALDKAAKTGVIKKNTASRKKSRFTKMISVSSK